MLHPIQVIQKRHIGGVKFQKVFNIVNTVRKPFVKDFLPFIVILAGDVFDRIEGFDMLVS